LKKRKEKKNKMKCAAFLCTCKKRLIPKILLFFSSFFAKKYNYFMGSQKKFYNYMKVKIRFALANIGKKIKLKQYKIKIKLRFFKK
jgi:hypothetical protein